jgi:hypothetical protein
MSMEPKEEDVRYPFGGLVWPIRIILDPEETDDVIVGQPECPDHGPGHIQRTLVSTIMLYCLKCGRGGPFMGDDMDDVSADVGRWALAEYYGKMDGTTLDTQFG